ncbi:MAG: membrane protein insertion efficiency factor YidD [Planctomycetes bacterium]|nr:membrane protein insertion efficiency factor YidD [Planctomycetota bacterium]
MNRAARALIAAARLYQRTLAWLVPAQCRFHPSCSHYFVEAVERHGSIRGTRLGLWRLLRCQPLARGGYDPVPPLSSRTARTAPPASDR